MNLSQTTAKRKWRTLAFGLTAAFVCGFVTPAAYAQAPEASVATAASESYFVERPVVNDDDSFITVRHVEIRGSNFEIGRKLAKLAQQRHGNTASEPADTSLAADRLAYFSEKFPVHAERMRGVAAGFGKELSDASFDFSSLEFGFAQAGCSVVYYPPSSTADGRGVLSRNFDFTTGTIDGSKPPAGQPAICAQPYIMELYPNEGYASLALVCYDLLGVVDGVNSEGLSVALLADDELVRRFGTYDDARPQAGLGVLQVGRMLLDTCANVEEAKAALKEHKLYYAQIPCHYIIADRHGNSFVWENNREMTDGYIFPGNGKPQATTNFMRFLHDDLTDLPAESHPSGSFNRYRKLCAGCKEYAGDLSLDAIKKINASVAANSPKASPNSVPGRTIWHSVYIPEERSLQVNFYLGEPEQTEDGIRRSEYFRFSLDSPVDSED